MVRYILLCICFLIKSIGFSQGWTYEELSKANTALNVSLLTYEEKEAIKYLNLARLYPQKFADVEVKNYLGPVKYGDYLKTSGYKQSLLSELQYKMPVGPLYFDEGMYSLAACFAKESGLNGKVGHNRVACTGGFEGECCSYGHEQGRDIVLQLLIDHDVPSLGHRKICLDDAYNKVGLSIQSHKIYGSCCVVDFKRGANNEYVITNKQNQYNPQTSYTQNFQKQTSTSYHEKSKLMSIKIGGSINILLEDPSTFNSPLENQVSYQLNTMLGFRIGRKIKQTSIGLFGNYGKYNPKNVIVLRNSAFNSKNNFLELEAGFLIKEIFRLSAGLGYSNINSFRFSESNYTSISTGISLGSKLLKFDMANTFIIQKLNQKIYYRPSVGLSLNFEFFKK